ncbi:Phosphatidylglycerophosphatase A [Candidatus Hepatincola sp. Av]
MNSFFNLPANFFNKKNKYLVVASLFGLGYFKYYPKIVTAFVVTLLAIVFGYFGNSLIVFLSALLIILSFFLVEQITKPSSLKFFVIDVATGQSLAIVIFPHNIPLMFLSFFIFSALTYFKPPFIINLIHASFKPNTAIIMDDIIIGFASLILSSLLAILI